MELEVAAGKSTKFYEELIKSISEPEPMCLVLVRYHISEQRVIKPISPGMKQRLPEAVAGAVHDRLLRNLRTYDLLSRVETNAFVAALKTMMDESELLDRLKVLEDNLSKPYLFQELQAVVQIDLGHAIRQPGEKPSALLKRADESADISRQSGGIGESE